MDLIALQREMVEALDDLRLAKHWLALANGDNFLAARWAILGVPIEDARRCVALGLDPEQLTRCVRVEGEDVPVAQFISELSDEALLQMIAEAGKPLPHADGRWLPVEETAWWCSGCGVRVPVDPRKRRENLKPATDSER